MLISLPVVGLFFFFFKKKDESELAEKSSVFVLAFVLYLALFLFVSSEIFLLAIVPYFSEKAFLIVFLILKIFLMVAHSYLMILELNKNCHTFCQNTIYPIFPALQNFEHWVGEWTKP